MNDLKALILAGGRGTRLMPITNNIPKPLVPLAGTPVISHILRKLRANGIRRAVVATGHGGDMIRSYLEANGTEGVEVELSHESEPHGTAGAAKMAMKHFDSDFLLLGGDVFFDFDFSEAVRLHKARNAVATVILSKSDYPCSFGSVCADANGKVEAFCEKPEWQDVVSNKISTGIYVLSPRIFDFIEDGAALDFAKDIFPKLLGSSLYSIFLDGYFSDIGTVDSFYKTSFDVMRMAGLDECNIVDPSAKISPSASVTDSIVMENAVVGSEAVVSGSILCRGAIVRPRAVVKNSVVENEVPLGAAWGNGASSKDCGTSELKRINARASGEYAEEISPEDNEMLSKSVGGIVTAPHGSAFTISELRDRSGDKGGHGVTLKFDGGEAHIRCVDSSKMEISAQSYSFDRAREIFEFAENGIKNLF